MKRITKTAWFRKKILGLGYYPVTLEGWLLIVVFVIFIFVDFVYFHRTVISYSIMAMILIILWIVAWLTSEEHLDKQKQEKITDEK
jgi:membrane-bound ClpP family serine protease